MNLIPSTIFPHVPTNHQLYTNMIVIKHIDFVIRNLILVTVWVWRWIFGLNFNMIITSSILLRVCLSIFALHLILHIAPSPFALAFCQVCLCSPGHVLIGYQQWKLNLRLASRVFCNAASKYIMNQLTVQQLGQLKLI